MTRNGIAVLRVDDRGVGGSEAGDGSETSVDFASDVAAGVAFLRAHPRINKKKIWLIGHSEGGYIAPMVAAKDKKIEESSLGWYGGNRQRNTKGSESSASRKPGGARRNIGLVYATL